MRPSFRESRGGMGVKAKRETREEEEEEEDISKLEEELD
jgi:hypothetical protein